MKNLTRYLFGRFYWVSHSKVLIYKGAWKNGVFNGFGRLKYINGSTYKGYFKNGIRHGTGTYRSGSGYSYSGQWILGEKTGTAQIQYINEDFYEGFTRNGLKHGEGELSVRSPKTTIRGKWKADILYGDVCIKRAAWTYRGPMPNADGYSKGILKYRDGSAYVGECLNLVRKGVGAYESKIGVQIEGIWTNEVDVTNAVLKDTHCITWQGSLKNLKPHGLMAVKLPNGNEYDGVWNNGTLQRLLSVENKSDNRPNQSNS